MKSLFLVLTFSIAFSANAQQISLKNQKVTLTDIEKNTPATHIPAPRVPAKHNGKIALKNFQVVIPGVLYRGGNSGGGNLPLNENGLDFLSKNGFSAAVYMYHYGWEKKPANTHGVDYTNFGTELKNPKNVYQFLAKVKAIIDSKDLSKDLSEVENAFSGKGPMYVHCWNGWHASGEMAAYALVQFCGMTPSAAQDYWNENVDAGKGSVKRIANWRPFPKLEISQDARNILCPR